MIWSFVDVICDQSNKEWTKSSIKKDTEETNEGVAASALAANAATTKTNLDILNRNHLFVPETLFHICRLPLENQQNQEVAKNQLNEKKEEKWRFRNKYLDTKWSRKLTPTTLASAALFCQVRCCLTTTVLPILRPLWMPWKMLEFHCKML